MKHIIQLKVLLSTLLFVFISPSFTQDSIKVPSVEKSAQRSKMLVLKPLIPEAYTGSESDVQELYDLLLFDSLNKPLKRST